MPSMFRNPAEPESSDEDSDYSSSGNEEPDGKVSELTRDNSATERLQRPSVDEASNDSAGENGKKELVKGDEETKNLKTSSNGGITHTDIGPLARLRPSHMDTRQHSAYVSQPFCLIFYTSLAFGI